jgi:hypothetical protein
VNEEVERAIEHTRTYARVLAAYYSALVEGGVPKEDALEMMKAREFRDVEGAREAQQQNDPLFSLFQAPPQ